MVSANSSEDSSQITFRCDLFALHTLRRWINQRFALKGKAMILNLTSNSDAGLLRRLQEAASKGVSAAELRAQRVSFIVSSVSDEKTKVTPQMVEAELKKLNGNAA